MYLYIVHMLLDPTKYNYIYIHTLQLSVCFIIKLYIRIKNILLLLFSHCIMSDAL